MKEFLIAIGFVFMIEGAILTFMPGRVKTILKYMETYPAESLRKIGFAAVVIGGAWVWYIK